jgi:hypothetical protein
MLARYLDEKGLGKRAPQNKRRQILSQMGYIPHPALADGRVNNLVFPDGSKPRLFVHRNSMAAQITTPVEAAKAYEVVNKGPMGHPAAYRAFGEGL